MNLLEETLELLKNNNINENDINWVGSKNIYTTWKNFKLISNIEYDNGFGGQEIATNLIIVGSNWWIERHEYDGSEWWELKKLPEKPNKEVILTKVGNGCWDTLEELNEISLN
jgi:hypothetical protein